jgi:hypothetical protein
MPWYEDRTIANTYVGKQFIYIKGGRFSLGTPVVLVHVHDTLHMCKVKRRGWHEERIINLDSIMPASHTDNEGAVGLLKRGT